MAEKDNRPIVKLAGQYWVLHEEKGDMVVLWRDGCRALVPKSIIETFNKS